MRLQIQEDQEEEEERLRKERKEKLRRIEENLEKEFGETEKKLR